MARPPAMTALIRRSMPLRTISPDCPRPDQLRHFAEQQWDILGVNRNMAPAAHGRTCHGRLGRREQRGRWTVFFYPGVRQNITARRTGAELGIADYQFIASLIQLGERLGGRG